MQMKCRDHCGACCIEPSITTGFYGMESGKLAGVPCVHLDEAMGCKIFGLPERPMFCGSLPPSLEMCGHHRDEALDYLRLLEKQTSPDKE